MAAGPEPRAKIAYTVTTLASPSFTPGIMGTKGGSWASSTKMVKATAVSTAMWVSLRTVIAISLLSQRPGPLERSVL